jgi:hypothetical protein
MNNEAVREYYNPAQFLAPVLEPVYIDASLFATLQKEGRVAEHIAVNSRSGGNSLFEYCVSIATVNHSLPTYQDHVQTTASKVNSIVTPPKPLGFFERIALDLDARFSKPDLKSKAEKAASDFLDAMAPDSKTDAATAVGCFDISIREILSGLDKFKASALAGGIEKEILWTFQKMAAKRFSESDSSVNSVAVEKVKAILEIVGQGISGLPGSTVNPISRSMANIVLDIFQKQLFANLNIQTKKITRDLMAAAEPGSTTKLAVASKVFEEKMKTIFSQKEHLKDHQLYKDFTKDIRESSNQECTDIFWADVKKGNIADWKAKSRKLAEENIAVFSETYPKDMLTPQAIFSKQLRWMKEEDFSNQIKASIKEVFPKRYELLVTTKSDDAQGVVDETKRIIQNFKQCLKNNCKDKNEKTIAEQIQKNRKELTKFLKAGDDTVWTLHTGSKCVKIAINKYLESNETELDLAVSAMLLDHIKNMLQGGQLIDN